MMLMFDPIIVTALMLISPLGVVPQIIKATKSVQGLSLVYFTLQLLFQIYYTFYYFTLGSFPLIVNGITASIVSAIMVFIIIFKRRK